MTHNSDNEPEDIEAAMNTVLQAERAAEQAIMDCRQAAAQILQEAQLRAQRIATRTDERLALCHMRCNGKVTREIKNRQRTASADSQANTVKHLDDAVLADMVSAVVRDLVGETKQDSEARDAT